MISVIIPTYNDDKRLNNCLRHIVNQTAYSQIDKIIIVNNSDSDIKLEFEDKKFSIIRELKPGSYAARNAGIRACLSEYIAFTDSDCEPDKSWIESGLQRLLHGNDRVAGRIFVPFDKNNSTSAYDHLFAFPQAQYCANGYAATANLFVKKSLFSMVGEFNEDLLSGGDEEWNLRATSLMIGLYFSDAAFVCHPARKTLSVLIAKERRLATNGVNRYLKLYPYLMLLLTAIIPPIWILSKIKSADGKVSKLGLHYVLLAVGIHYLLRWARLLFVTLYRLGLIQECRG